MQVSIEIRVFPLDKNYSPAIHAFIDSLSRHLSIKIKVQAMSTLITGDFNECMRILQTELEKIMNTDKTIITHINLINRDMSDQ
jgi:uncharacterized protein YqgV (UPF0045/DUF77 family)